jgi:hypothetical protein
MRAAPNEYYKPWNESTPYACLHGSHWHVGRVSPRQWVLRSNEPVDAAHRGCGVPTYTGTACPQCGESDYMDAEDQALHLRACRARAERISVMIDS